MTLAAFFGVSTDWLLGHETEAAPAVLRETPPEYLIDDAMVELDALKERVQSLERALHLIKENKLRDSQGPSRTDL